MNIAEIKKSAEQKMQKSVEALKLDLGKVRTGRAHTGLLDHLHVDYYGTPMPINQCANVTLSDARGVIGLLKLWRGCPRPSSARTASAMS